MFRNLTLVAFLSALAPILLPCLPAEASTKYDMVKEFSIKENPAGVWSYWSDYHNVPLTNAHHRCWGRQGLECWYDDNMQPGGRTMIGLNKTGQTVTFDKGNVVFETGYIMLDPEYEGNGYVQFTAPVAGTYLVKGRYVPLALKEPAGDYCYVDQVGSENKTLWERSVNTGHTRRFNLTVTLAQGDTLQFEVRRIPGKVRNYVGVTAEITGP